MPEGAWGQAKSSPRSAGAPGPPSTALLEVMSAAGPALSQFDVTHGSGATIGSSAAVPWCHGESAAWGLRGTVLDRMAEPASDLAIAVAASAAACVYVHAAPAPSSGCGAARQRRVVDGG